MADLFLHLPFARRLRFAEGLHPLPGEAIGRRPALVVLGAALAGLPENERRGMSWLRRLFSRGGEAARWQKLLAPTPGNPHIDVIVELLSPDDAALGPLARLALGLGVLSHEILEEKVGPLTASLQESQRAAIERAQARLWMQSAIPGHLEQEWKPVLELADPEANKRALQHVDRALKRVHGSGPGEAALARWLKGLAAEIGPLAEGRGSGGALPPSLSVSDSDARSTHFDTVEFMQKAQAAVSTVVGVANRLGEAFTQGSPDAAAVRAAVQKLVEMKNGEVEESRTRWKAWLQAQQEVALTRGRNTKPAFIEGEVVPEAHQRVPAATAVMRLSDLPPEVTQGAPPLPVDASGPVTVKPPPPPTATQEVSIAQIEAEGAAMSAAAAREFQAPAHTQEVSLAQIESLIPVRETPDQTQEVQTAQVVESNAAKITQPISAADLAAANAEDLARAATGAPPPPVTEPPVTEPPKAAESAPTETHSEAPPATAAPPAASNGANGVSHDDEKSADTQKPGDGADAEAAKAADAKPGDDESKKADEQSAEPQTPAEPAADPPRE